MTCIQLVAPYTNCRANNANFQGKLWASQANTSNWRKYHIKFQFNCHLCVSCDTPPACYPYYSTAPRPGPSHKPIGKDWTPSIYAANGAYCTSAGTTSCPTMKFCVVLACLMSHTSSVNEDWASLVILMSPDFEAMYRQTGSFEFAPRRGTASGLRRSGDVLAADHLPPGSTRSAVTRVYQRPRPFC